MMRVTLRRLYGRGWLLCNQSEWWREYLIPPIAARENTSPRRRQNFGRSHRDHLCSFHCRNLTYCFRQRHLTRRSHDLPSGHCLYRPYCFRRVYCLRRAYSFRRAYPFLRVYCLRRAYPFRRVYCLLRVSPLRPAYLFLRASDPLRVCPLLRAFLRCLTASIWHKWSCARLRSSSDPLQSLFRLCLYTTLQIDSRSSPGQAAK